MSRLPTTVTTANGSTDTTEEVTVDVKDVDMFVTIELLEGIPAVLFPEKLFEDNGYSYEWEESQTPNLTQNGKIVLSKCDNVVPIVVLGLSSKAHFTNSVEDSAENTKELTPDDQEMTRASRSRLQDLLECWMKLRYIWWNQDPHPLEVTAKILQKHLVWNLFHQKHQKGSTIYSHICSKKHL